MKGSYLAWLASDTAGDWTNDSALCADIENAVKNGAVGATTNPPLSYEALMTETDLYGEALAALRGLPDDDFALEAMGLVVRRVSERFLPMHREMGGYFGCVRAQVAPQISRDAEGMLKAGKKIASWGENVMVKIPGTKAGIETLQELAALGIPTNPTVVTTVSQMIAAAEAHERGAARAKKAGIAPPWCTSALVMGRLQDYLAGLNARRGNLVSASDLEWASIAVVKRAHRIFQEKGYSTTIMGAAFRCAMHVEQIAGAPFCSTIHPKIQALVEEADRAGAIRREACIDEPVDQAIIDRVSKALPEFVQAYEPEGLSVDEFDDFGAVVMTLDCFNETGWKKLITLKQEEWQ